MDPTPHAISHQVTTFPTPLISLSAPTPYLGTLKPHSDLKKATYQPLTSSRNYHYTPTRNQILSLYEPESSCHNPPTYNISNPPNTLTPHLGTPKSHSDFNEATYLPLSSSFHHLHVPTKNQILTLYGPEHSSYILTPESTSNPQ